MINLIEQLKRHEGFEPDFYCCTAGKKTIGFGRNVDNNPFSEVEELFLGENRDFRAQPMTEDEAEFLLGNDVQEIYYQLQGIVNFDLLNRAREAVVVNMTYNLGLAGFKKFKKTIELINAGEFDNAAREMFDSLWAKQVPSRAQELMLQMCEGKWQ